MVKSVRRLGVPFAAVLLGALLTVTVAQAALRVTIGAQGTVAEAGEAVYVPVSVTCDPAMTVLEAHLSVSQNESATWGMAGIGPLQCDSRPHAYVVRVPAQDGAYQSGPAHASAYVLQYDPVTGTTSSAQDTRTVRLR